MALHELGYHALSRRSGCHKSDPGPRSRMPNMPFGASENEGLKPAKQQGGAFQNERVMPAFSLFKTLATTPRRKNIIALAFDTRERRLCLDSPGLMQNAVPAIARL